MRKLVNPYRKYKEYNCFGCSQDNPFGLKMQFFEDGDDIYCEWDPDNNFQGYHNVLHGGIQTTMMDEIASWVVYVKLKTSGVTKKIETNFLSPVYINKGKIYLRARLSKVDSLLASVEVKLYDPNMKVCTESIVQYFTFPERIARQRFHYPGHEEFYEKNDSSE